MTAEIHGRRLAVPLVPRSLLCGGMLCEQAKAPEQAFACGYVARGQHRRDQIANESRLPFFGNAAEKRI